MGLEAYYYLLNILCHPTCNVSLRVRLFEVDRKSVKGLLDDSILAVRVDEQGLVHLQRTVDARCRIHARGISPDLE
jgi:hypothetical protein